jgi:hypothetical protein
MRVAATVTVMGAALLSACGGGSSSSSGNANVRLLNASVGYDSLDLQLDTTTANKAVTYGTAGSYASAVTTGVSTTVTPNGSTSALSVATRTFSKDVNYTLVAYGWAGALKTGLIQEDVAAADSGKTKLQLQNLAPDAGIVDVYLTGDTESLDAAVPLASGLSGGGSSGYISVNAGTYRLRVTANGDRNDLRLDTKGLVLGSTQVANLLLTSGGSGVLVNSMLVLQQGAATKLSNTQSRIRPLLSLSGAVPFSISVGGTVLSAGTAAQANPALYTAITSGTSVPVALTLNGVNVPVANQALEAGKDYILMVRGTAAAPTVTLISEDNRLPLVATNAKIRLLNATVGTLPQAMTLSADFSPLANSVAPGAASSYANLASSTSVRLDVTNDNGISQTSTLTAVPLAAKGLYTVYVFGDASNNTPSISFRKDR